MRYRFHRNSSTCNRRSLLPKSCTVNRLERIFWKMWSVLNYWFNIQAR